MQYRYQQSFAEDPIISKQLFDLLEIVFPEIELKSLAASAKAFGASWEDASTPFIRFHNDIAISHVGVLEIPMQLVEQKVNVGGIHAVSTHPEFRRRGYYRDIMQEVLTYCEQKYDTLVLTTSQPEIYEPFGFRVVKEHNFIAKCNATGHKNGFRLLNTLDDNDKKLVHRLLETRAPVSDIVGIFNAKALFYVNEGTRTLHYADDLDVIVCMEIKDNRLKLFDLVGTKIPTLDAILDRIPDNIQEVTIYFTPDRLDVNTQAIPHVLDGAMLMVRGAFAAEGKEFMFPRSARC